MREERDWRVEDQGVQDEADRIARSISPVISKRKVVPQDNRSTNRECWQVGHKCAAAPGTSLRSGGRTRSRSCSSSRTSRTPQCLTSVLHHFVWFYPGLATSGPVDQPPQPTNHHPVGLWLPPSRHVTSVSQTRTVPTKALPRRSLLQRSKRRKDTDGWRRVLASCSEVGGSIRRPRSHPHWRTAGGALRSSDGAATTTAVQNGAPKQIIGAPKGRRKKDE